MGKIVQYISPSIIPSRSANSVHVLNQCNSLAKKCRSVKLFFATDIFNITPQKINEFYGIKLESNVCLKQTTVNKKFSMQIRIAFNALMKINLTSKNQIIISRNLYFSFLVTLLKKSHIYEAHGLEFSKLKKRMQNFILSRNKKTIAISVKLTEMLRKQCPISENIMILHDAASIVKKENVTSFIKNRKRFKVGYFGHLYSGRGISVIKTLAKKMIDVDFYVVGGDEENINKLKLININRLHILGFLKNLIARSLMSEMDLLLMPYQRKVSIGIDKSDTSKWMSPLKMFEYMSSKTPLISSNLPVLREVLEHEKNCLLVDPDNIYQWHEAIMRIKENPQLGKKIAIQAHKDFITKYTWDARAEKLLDYGS